MRPKEIARSKDVTAHSTEKSAKAAPRPWEIEQYIYQEEPRDDQRSSHDDPRLEFAPPSSNRHPDGDSDGDPQSLHPAFGLGLTPDLHARASTASDLGTLAGASNQQIDAWLRSLSQNEQNAYYTYIAKVQALIREGYDHSYAKSTAKAVHPTGAEVAENLNRMANAPSTQHGESSQSQGGNNLARTGWRSIQRNSSSPKASIQV